MLGWPSPHSPCSLGQLALYTWKLCRRSVEAQTHNASTGPCGPLHHPINLYSTRLYIDCNLPVCFVKPQVHLLKTHRHTQFPKVYNIIAVYHYIYTTTLTVTTPGLLSCIVTVTVIYSWTSPCQPTTISVLYVWLYQIVWWLPWMIKHTPAIKSLPLTATVYHHRLCQAQLLNMIIYVACLILKYNI